MGIMWCNGCNGAGHTGWFRWKKVCEDCGGDGMRKPTGARPPPPTMPPPIAPLRIEVTASDEFRELAADAVDFEKIVEEMLCELSGHRCVDPDECRICKAVNKFRLAAGDHTRVKL